MLWSMSTIPTELRTEIGGEPTDFVIRARWARTRSMRFKLLAVGMFSAIGNSVVLTLIFWKMQTNTHDNALPIFATVWGLGSLSIAGTVFVTALERGGFFVSTPKRLIQFKTGRLTSTQWDSFDGRIEIDDNAQNGSVSLYLRQPHAMTSSEKPTGTSPAVIHLAGIEDPQGIARVSRQRIEENSRRSVLG